MSAVIDNNLTLLYQNMVGLSNIINNTSGDSYFIASFSVNSNLYVSNNTILNDNLTLNSNLNLLGNTLVYGPFSMNSSLNIGGLTNIYAPTTINSSLYTLGNTTINNNLFVNSTALLNNTVTINSTLNVTGTTTFAKDINVNNINGSSLNIIAPSITIGNSNSNVFINGTATYVASTETLIIDKLISLNVNSTTLQGADSGFLSGIEIMGISSYGFIMTTSDASRYQIQSPLQYAPTNYITVQDLNNNLVISGNTNLISNVTANSLLNVSGISIFKGPSTIKSAINISGSTLINGSCSINMSSSISGQTVLNNDCSVNSYLSINGLLNINNSTSINSSLNVAGSLIINGQLIIGNDLNISGTTNINNSTSVNSSININGLTVINGPISMNSYLNISNVNIVGGDETINSNLYASGVSILNSTTTINSSLLVSGLSIMNNNITINSNLNVAGNIYVSLPNYNLNSDAKNAGIPIWGFYRTGGVLKIRLNDVPPIIYFSGSTTLSINVGSSYTDPGAYAIDYFNNYYYNSIYLISINSGSSNLLTSNILITSTSTLVSQTSILPSGSYTATYRATDSSNNFGYNYRKLKIIPNPLTPYDSTIIRVSCRYYTDYTISPVFQTSPNLWYWSPPYNTDGFGGAGISWALSTSYLNSISFQYNSSWCFVLKVKRNLPVNGLVIGFDSNLSDWVGPNALLDFGVQFLSVAESNVNGTGFPNRTYSNNNLFDAGIYMNISFNYLNYVDPDWPLTDNGYLKIEFCDLSGNIIFSSTGIAKMRYSNRIIPFSMYDIAPWEFSKGVYYNSTGYVNYSTFSSYF